MFIKNLLYFITIFVSLNSYSNPTPLGLELNKATASDLIKKYTITGKELNYWQGHNYFIEPNEKYTSQALVICNDFNIIEAVILTIDKNKFEEFYKILKDKYILVDNVIEQESGKMATFRNDDCLVILESSEDNSNMELVYITNNFYKDFLNKLEKEEKLEQIQIKNLL
ncbi:hypothetical protein BA173_01865 [Rickettsia sp. MEAM1 (Bemisia tabaci)]|uniref:hypothetical protein n=1 Tax=unclassified Rickettsia TaxID=114295 RepID=UPI0002EA4732|nr:MULTISPECIES: hypothetical protein [unclassified Rickettsia]ASX27647.1 hypothetical protein BA173_01865 [Rickettsia sp. MEAM1 (Bemisia tabaci)]ODA37526.1 hypothetical protein A8V33_02025 [Rickettsia sp. wb]ODA38048.1 hypothetical protein A8V34_04505 [Rickettsia sp. wq]